MAHTTVGAKPPARYAVEFMIRRFARIWPVLAVAALTFVLVTRIAFGQYSSQTLGVLVSTLLFIPNGAGPGPGFGTNVPTVTWTLNYEIYFYAFFATSMLFGRFRWIALTSWALFSLIAYPLSHLGYWTSHPGKVYGFAHPYVALMTYPIIWEFLAGVALGLLYNSKLRVPKNFPSGLLMALALAMVAWQYIARFNVGYGFTEWGITLVPLVAVFALANKQSELTHHPALTYLGNISFSLYLWHPLVHAVAGFPLIWLGYGDRCTGFSFVLYTTIVSVAVAALSHRYLELGLAEVVKTGLLRIVRSGQRSPSIPASTPRERR